VKIELLFICGMIFGLCFLGVELVKTEHYSWAWIPFLMAASVSYRNRSD
jgi:hypothetical protein